MVPPNRKLSNKVAASLLKRLQDSVAVVVSFLYTPVRFRFDVNRSETAKKLK